jgi:hypothetical protein
MKQETLSSEPNRMPDNDQLANSRKANSTLKIISITVLVTIISIAIGTKRVLIWSMNLDLKADSGTPLPMASKS